MPWEISAGAAVGGGEVRSRVTMSRQVRRNRLQSATAACTSATTERIRSRRASRCSTVGIRSVSRCIQDSERPPRPPTSSSRPWSSRRTVTTGCRSRCTVGPASAMAAATESTRNGTSSVQICTIVRREVQPFSAMVGVKTAARVSPGRRPSASSTMAARAPVTSRGSLSSKPSRGSLLRSRSISAVVSGIVVLPAPHGRTLPVVSPSVPPGGPRCQTGPAVGVSPAREARRGAARDGPSWRSPRRRGRAGGRRAAVPARAASGVRR